MTNSDIRRRTVRVPVEVTMVRPARRGGEWTAEAGQFRAEGATEKAAADALVTGLQALLRVYREPQVITFRGYVAVISPGLGDYRDPIVWHTQVVKPSGSSFYSSGTTAGGWEEAKADARCTIAHATTDWHDDDSVHEAARFLEGGERFDSGQYGPDELYRYAAWQRAAKHASDEGMPDLHEWATRHRNEFRVPRPERENEIEKGNPSA